MPDLSIRKLTEDEHAALKIKAAAAKKSVEAYVRDLILESLRGPIVYQSYILKAYGPGPAHATIHRIADDAVTSNAELCNEAQINTYQEAKGLIKSNRPEEREKALGIMREQFEDVRIVLI